jgi:transcriptional regulator with XRE-family HTH domain
MRGRRSELGRSQEQVALDAGIDRAYYSGIERGEQNASYATLLSIADALCVRLWELQRQAEK